MTKLFLLIPAVIFLIVMVYAIFFAMFFPSNDDSCGKPFFQSSSHINTNELYEKTYKITGMTAGILGNQLAELSNIKIIVLLPPEVNIDKSISYTGGLDRGDSDDVVITTSNNTVSFSYNKKKKNADVYPTIFFDSISKNWSKPIEVEYFLVFKRLKQCSSTDVKDGRYTMKTTLTINPKDGRYYPKEGRKEGEWVYLGVAK